MATITGTALDDILNGTKSDDLIEGLDGNDTLFGDKGNDTLNGGDGDDTLSGGKGNDVLDGGEGSDTYLYDKKDKEGDTYQDSGTSGTDTLDLSSTTKATLGPNFTPGHGLEFITGDVVNQTSIVGPKKSAVNWDFSGGLIFLNIKDITGSKNNDTITGSDGNDIILGDKGDDVLNGGDGDDTLSGGKGNDILDGGEGSDTYLYDKKDKEGDTYQDSGTSGTDTLDASSTTKLILGSAFDADSGIEIIQGDNIKQTTIFGPKKAAVDWDFTGVTLQDIKEVKGSKEDDRITGSDSNDVILGDKGNDLIDGGLGNDQIDGGNDDDIIIYDANDTIKVDGGKGEDTLQLTLNNESIDLDTINPNVFVNFEAIDITGTGNNEFTLDVSEISGFSSTGTLRILGNTGDSVNAGGGWTLKGNTTINGIDFTEYRQGSVVLQVQADIDQSDITIGVIELGNLGGAVGFQIDGSSKGDNMGRSVSSAGDINGDGYDDIIIGAPYADPHGSSSGEAYVIFGKGTPFDSRIDPADLNGTNGFRLQGIDANDISGIRVSGLGDINGDGYGDLIVAAPQANISAGESYVVYGKADGFASTMDLSSLDGTNGFTIKGASSTDYSGFGLSGAGDVNGDGLNDILIGAFGADPFIADSGESYLILGRTNFGDTYELSTVTNSDSSNADQLNGGDQNSLSGFAVSNAGDVNGDGYNDIIIGAALENPTGPEINGQGVSYLVFGSETLPFQSKNLSSISSNLGFQMAGIDILDFSGFSVSGGGDINGDGFDDLIVGAPYANPDGSVANGTGEIYVIFGHGGSFSSTLQLSSLNGTNGFRIAGIDPEDGAGISVSNAGDVNGDGYDDLIIGAPNGDPDGNKDAGESYLLFGKASGFSSLIRLNDLDGTNGLLLTGSNKGDNTGYSVSSAGDINGDGFDDLLIAAIFGDSGGKDSGQTYVLFGKDFRGDVDFLGTNADDILTGTAGDEILIGGFGDDVLDGGAGNDVLMGGAGNDILVYDPDDQHKVDGGKGEDTLRIDLANTTFDFPQVINANHYKTFTNIEIIDLTDNGNTIILNKQDVQALSSTSNTLTITGVAGNTVILPDNWTFNGSTMVNGIDFNSYSKGTVTVLIDEDITTKNPISSLNLIDLHPSNNPDGSNGVYIPGLNPNDNTGRSVSTIGDFNGDGFADIILGASGADPNGESSGESYVLFGKGDTFSNQIDLNSLFSTNGGNGQDGFVVKGINAGDFSGRSVSFAGDVNSDGFDDLIIGAPLSDINGTNSGQSYIIYGHSGSQSPEIELSSFSSGDGSVGTVINGIDGTDWSGFSVNGGGDVNGDGYSDIVIGAPFATPNGSNSGQSFVLFGAAAGLSAQIELSSLLSSQGGDGTQGFTLNGLNSKTGFSVSNSGDINNDGYDDVLIGAQNKNYVFFGKADGFDAEFDLHTLESGDGSNGFVLLGGLVDSSTGLTGRSVNFLDDINGDGINDIVIGSPLTNKVYVYFGKEGSFDNEFTLSTLASGDGSEGFVINGIVTGDELGFSVSDAGDVNGDGINDLVIGAPHADINDNSNKSGEIYIIYGNKDGFDASLNLSSLLLENGGDGSKGIVIYGFVGQDEHGSAVSSAGDINGDGFDDIVIGAQYGLSTAEGLSHIIFGRDFTGDIDFIGTENNDVLTGTSADEELIGGLGNDILDGGAGNDVLKGGAGDDILNGGAGNDILIGGSGNDVLNYHSGDTLRVDGGTGTDTLKINGSNLVFNLTEINLTEYYNLYTGIEVIDLAGTGNNVLYLNDLDLLHLSDTSNTLRVDGNAGDQVIVTEHWTTGITADGYTEYTFNNATLLLNTDVAFNYVMNLADLDGTNGFKINGEAFNDRSGRSVSNAGDVNGDGFDDVIIGAYFADPNGSYSGASYIVFGKTGGFDPEINLSSLDGINGFQISGEFPGDHSGFVASYAGDINGDGFDDVIIGAPYADPNSNNFSGASHVIYGKEDFSATNGVFDLSDIVSGASFKISGVTANDVSAWSVSFAGDINGDGLDDVIIGAPSVDAGDDNTGASYVIFGKAEDFAADLQLSSLDGQNGFRITYTGFGTLVSGYSVSSAGDINGDSFDDLIIGSGIHGFSHIVFGKSDWAGTAGNLELSSLDGTNGFMIRQALTETGAGKSVSSAGDINGDGFSDLIIGDPTNTANGNLAGASYVVFGKQDWSDTAGLFSLLLLNSPDGFKINGQSSNNGFGGSVSSAGDINGDGYDDLIIGAIGNSLNGLGAGTSYVIFGGEGLSDSLDSSGNFILNSTNGFLISGEAIQDYSGISVSSAGDINGDGFDDLIIGAHFADSNGIEISGSSYVIFGYDYHNEVDFLGTDGDDVLTGTSADEILIGGLGDDTLDGGVGNDMFKGAAGDDILVYDSNDTLKIDGGSGLDTLRFDGAGESLDLTGISNLRYQGIEKIDLTGTGDNSLTLDIRDVLALPDHADMLLAGENTKQLLIDGNAGDTVNSTGQDWTSTGTEDIGGIMYNSYTHADIVAQLFVDMDITQNIS